MTAMAKKPLDLVPLAELARSMGMHRETLLKRLRALEHELRRRIIVQREGGSRRYVDRAYLARLNGDGGRSLEQRIAELEQRVRDLEEQVRDLEH